LPKDFIDPVPSKPSERWHADCPDAVGALWQAGHVGHRRSQRKATNLSNDGELKDIAPALAAYEANRLRGDLWKRSALPPRDRSLVTVAALVARNQPSLLGREIDLALENGVTPAELIESITHLAFYAGWGNALAAIDAVRPVFVSRRIDASELPPAAGEKLPLDEASEAQRVARVEAQFGAIVPALVGYTTDVLFRDLWLRPALAPRDRSLVTVSALIAAGHFAQANYHFTRAMANGLTSMQAAEVVTHLAFYAGWPSAMSAAAVLKEILEKRTT
jgi:4-carboxymuconolactone decarboxylase